MGTARPFDDPSDETRGAERRPLVSGLPVYAGAALVLVAVTLLVLSFQHEPGLDARISQEYVAMMAGTLTPAFDGADASAAAASLSRTLPFTPAIHATAGEFGLIGGRVHQLDGRPMAVWFYRSAAAEMALAAAFRGALDELGPAGETRTGAHPSLRVFRKSTQTIVFWQHDSEVYVFVSTLPGERVIGLARQLATSPAGQERRE